MDRLFGIHCGEVMEMAKEPLRGVFMNQPNIKVLFETIAKLKGEELGVNIEITNFRRKTPEELERCPNKIFVQPTEEERRRILSL